MKEVSVNKLETTVNAVLDDVKIDSGGGCSVFKALTMALLIRDEQLKCTLDIGVYRGRSLFPQAIAHKLYTGGVAFGVDPWDPVEAFQHEAPLSKQAEVTAWTERTDLQRVYEEAIIARDAHELADHCVFVRKTSTNAIQYFRDGHIWFDLIHIDGNHDSNRVEEDISNYLPRLRRGGYLLLDDISWDSIRPTYDRMRRDLTFVFELVDEANDFALLWNSTGAFGAQSRRLRQAYRMAIRTARASMESLKRFGG